MDEEDYTRKMKDILDDDKYCILSCDPTLKVEKKIASSLKAIHQDGNTSNKVYDQLISRYTESTQVYGSPKSIKEYQ